MSFSVHGSEVALCNGDVLIYNLNDGTERTIVLPKIDNGKEVLHNNDNIELFHALTCVIFSDDGKYLLVCANRKQLCLYETETLKLISNWTVNRAVSKVRFTPKNNVIVADKSGDAYLYSSSKPQEKGILLLGHLSMLLDILVTDDEKFVITADRDEKIRVSKFPNSYNIELYCLGHTKFVTNIALVPNSNDILVSSGGDGTLIFWEFKTGRILLTENFCERIQQDDIHKLNDALRGYEIPEDVPVLPVKDLAISKIDDETSILCLSLHCSKMLLIYKLYCKSLQDIRIEYVESMVIDHEPLECLLHKNQLWILTEKSLETYKFDKNCFQIDEMDQLKKLNTAWTNFNNLSVKTILPMLYKRKLDNVQEYQERKRSRLTKTNNNM